MRRLPCLAALSVVATLAFACVAMAQQGPAADYPGPCSVVAEQFGTDPDYLAYIPEVDGCVFVNGYVPALGPLINPVFDAQTGEELGVFKDLVDAQTQEELGLFKDLLDFDFPYEAACGAFSAPEGYQPPAGFTAQQYFEQRANAQHRAILDPNGDGLACTAEDAAFLSGSTVDDGAAAA